MSTILFVEHVLCRVRRTYLIGIGEEGGFPERGLCVGLLRVENTPIGGECGAEDVDLIAMPALRIITGPVLEESHPRGSLATIRVSQPDDQHKPEKLSRQIQCSPCGHWHL